MLKLKKIILFLIVIIFFSLFATTLFAETAEIKIESAWIEGDPESLKMGFQYLYSKVLNIDGTKARASEGVIVTYEITDDPSGQSYTLNASESGSYWLQSLNGFYCDDKVNYTVVAEKLGQLVENSGTYTILCQPDYIITDISIEKRASDISEYIYVTIKNQGEDYYGGNHHDISVNAQEIDSLAKIYTGGYTLDSMKKEDSIEVKLIPALDKKTSGEYTIGATANYTFDLAETNTNNNSMKKVITADVQGTKKPDLTVTELKYYAPGITTPKIGDLAGYEVTIKNIGDAEAKGPFTTNANLNNYFLKSKYYDSSFILLPGKSYTDKVSGEAKISQTGANVITIRIDSNLNIDESNEDNNSFTKTITVKKDEAACTDTDAGKDYNNKGAVNIQYEDFCSTPEKLKEYYCKDDGSVGYEIYECPSKYCNFGKCFVETSLPDFSVTDMTIKSNSAGNQEVYVKIKNSGGTIYLGPSKILKIKVVDLDSNHEYTAWNSKSFNSGDELEISVGTVESKIINSFRLQSTADYTKQFEETNENNNTFEKTITIKNSTVSKYLGKLIKAYDTGAIYRVNEDGRRDVLPENYGSFTGYKEAVLDSNGWIMDDVITIPQSEAESLPLGKNLTIKSESNYLLKKYATDIYYIIDNVNNLRQVNKNDFSSYKIVVIPDAYFVNYNVTGDSSIIFEQVKCIFKGSETEQKCYIAANNNNLSCSGNETCIIDVKRAKDEKVTWKSSCGGYAYTKMDGQNESAEFNCTTTTKNPKLAESKVEIIEMEYKAKDMFNDKYENILSELKELRDTVKEQANKIKYLEKLTKGVEKIALKMEDALNNFITYGVDENTKKLGAGERAAVMYSYKSAFNKLPETEEELVDAIKIANGRWPSITSIDAEKRAKEQFQKIYKRVADMNETHDNAAITVMAYGLRQKAENRNLDSEKVGINTFKNIYGYNPDSTDDWNIMQAITYSGATRDKDTDGDLLADVREAELGTDPNNPDSDGDGFLDGVEVANGYNPLGEGKME
ncbi:MAG: CARDB domain-containing protein [Patescibacteria group bacterium]